MKVYTLYSKKLKSFLTPTFHSSDETAIEAATTLFSSFRVEDSFDMYQISQFDRTSGKLLKSKKRFIKSFDSVSKFFDEAHSEVKDE